VGCLALPLLAALTLASDASPATSYAFKTPSGNIGCIYEPPFQGTTAYLRCDIHSGLKNPAVHKPKNCDLDYGDSLEVSNRGRTIVVCHGDTAFDPHAHVLAYGTTLVRPGFKCVSQTTGLRCTNTVGHGFFLSRERWQAF
jgi:hypothetical protein